ncbi:DUF58 domain-containing protein [Halorientalis litorea]|uniref:DUF58 domain-containing protein n=1 Tax=Halorientalis litorea TaxID=2931977 RepID=UPI001FF63F4D|nr:DUF58 domain-containing protein [Halorientalis litorea]
MDATRRYWQTALVGLVLAGGAVVFDRPLLLGGAATVAGYLLTTQYDFARSLGHLDDALSVTQRVTPGQTGVEEPAQVTLDVTATAPVDADVTASLSVPAGVRVEDGQSAVTLGVGDTQASATVTVTAPVAGTHEFDTPPVTVTESAGRFTETLRRGDSATLFARPPTPQDVYVGQGENEVATGFGDHTSSIGGAGLEPEELREYQPGDAARRIDWKATARLDDAHVREFEVDTDRTTVLVFDHRESMATGVPGRTKVAYAREVALAVLDSTSAASDPVGLYTVGDEGITATVSPAATNDHYERVRRTLVDATPTDSSGRTETGTHAAGTGTDLSQALTGESEFTRTLRPFFESGVTYVDRVTEDPLFATVQSRVRPQQGTVWTMLFTDDTNRAEVLEAVRLARQGGNHVVVFLTPGVLFGPGALSDVGTAYDDYRSFESFRERLDRLSRVTALEVGPGDRVAAVLAERAERRRRA